MIRILGIADTPASKQLFMIREVKTRIAAVTEQHSNELALGVESKETLETIRMYQMLLKKLGTEYRGGQ